MKHIYLNLKRFDIPKELGGVNSIATPEDWGSYIAEHLRAGLNTYGKAEVDFTAYMPEAHIISAVGALLSGDALHIGSQGVYRMDTAAGGNFGAFTSNRTGNAMKALGCTSTIIGHCEERNDKLGILQEAGVSDLQSIDRILNKEVKAAIAAGLHVLFCIGEGEEELDRWQEVLKRQLALGLEGVDVSGVTIAYEPIWSIGPGKTPAGAEYITKIADFVKEQTGGMDVVYGGGLKKDNAEMLAGIQQIDGGLIALTRFAGEIGFYPEEFLEIVELYLGK